MAAIRRLAWTPSTDAAFERTKQLFIQGIKLFIVNPDKPFFVRTDASNYAVGAALEQVDVDGSITGKPGSPLSGGLLVTEVGQGATQLVAQGKGGLCHHRCTGEVGRLDWSAAR